jgi:predicted enzyme related to lactoylglutathione lyase
MSSVSPVRVFRIAVPTRDIARSRSFYEAVLGIDADDTVPTRLYFHCGDVIVAVIDWSVEGRGEFAPTPDNLYFAVDDLEGVFRRAVAAEAQITSPVQERPWGERSFYCSDLDGNLLCFVDNSTLFLGRGATWA